MRPHFFLFRQKEIAAPGERKTGFFNLNCGHPTSVDKPEYDACSVARYGRTRIRFRLHVGLRYPQQRFRFNGALPPRAPAAYYAVTFPQPPRLAALPRERPRSSRFAKPNVILRGGERYFDCRPIGRRNHVSSYRGAVEVSRSPIKKKKDSLFHRAQRILSHL